MQRNAANIAAKIADVQRSMSKNLDVMHDKLVDYAAKAKDVDASIHLLTREVKILRSELKHMEEVKVAAIRRCIKKLGHYSHAVRNNTLHREALCAGVLALLDECNDCGAYESVKSEVTDLFRRVSDIVHDKNFSPDEASKQDVKTSTGAKVGLVAGGAVLGAATVGGLWLFEGCCGAAFALTIGAVTFPWWGVLLLIAGAAVLVGGAVAGVMYGVDKWRAHCLDEVVQQMKQAQADFKALEKELEALRALASTSQTAAQKTYNALKSLKSDSNTMSNAAIDDGMFATWMARSLDDTVDELKEVLDGFETSSTAAKTGLVAVGPGMTPIAAFATGVALAKAGSKK